MLDDTNEISIKGKIILSYIFCGAMSCFWFIGDVITEVCFFFGLFGLVFIVVIPQKVLLLLRFFYSYIFRFSDDCIFAIPHFDFFFRTQENL